MSAASRFWAMARMARPNCVWRSTSHRPPNAATAAPAPMMRVQVSRMLPISMPSKPYCVSTRRGVAVKKYCITWMMMIDRPSVIRMLRSNSSGFRRTSNAA